MIKFNDNNIYVGYIKQLLKDFNLPMCQIYKEELKNFYSDDILYIKDKFLYRGNRVVDNYEFDTRIYNVTNNYHINSNIYDPETHRYLGEYLRFIRDYTGLNLMQMYNCFTNESVTNLVISKNNSVILDSSEEKYTTFILPIKYNQKYTIGLDCFGEVVLATCHYANKDVVEIDEEPTVMYESGTKFNKPFIFESPKVTSSSDLLNEKTLRLAIRIPSSCKSSIVVLEGDYTRGCELYVDNEEDKQVLASTVPCGDNDEPVLVKYDIEDSDEVGYINYYISRPQLLYLNSGEHYLLADRLIEYLSMNAIDSNEEIEDNIKLVQREVYDKNFCDKYMNSVRYIPEFYGKWDDAIRESLYNFAYKSIYTVDGSKLINNFFDMFGYYDKDIESRLHSHEYDDLKASSKKIF